MTPPPTTTWIDLPGLPADSGLRARAFRDADDFERIADVVRRANLHDDVPWLPTGEVVRIEIENEGGMDAASDVVLVEQDGEVVAEAEIWRIVRDGRELFEIVGHVVPEVRGRGIGHALLAANLRRARERAAAGGVVGPIRVRASVDATETAHRAMLAAAGFEVVRQFFVMRRPTLDDLRPVPLPEGLEIREVVPEHHRAIFDAEAEAFLDHWGAREMGDDQFAMTFERPDLDTRPWVVAWDGDEIAGVVQSWIWSDENERLGVRRGWLEHISVRRPWRRRGLAAAIATEAMIRLRAAGMDEAALGVDAENLSGALGLYERLGFEVFTSADAYQLDHPV